MNRTGKIVVALMIAALASSFILFGIREDKTWLCAPLSALIYLSAAVWLASCMKNRFSGGIAVPPGGIPLLLFWFYSMALIPFSVLPYEAKISALSFGVYLSVYWISSILLSQFSRRQIVWTVLAVLLVVTALYSVVQHRTTPNLLFGAERYTQYWQEGRLGGTYQCPNHIAHLFQMWLPFCLVFIFIPQFGWFWRIFFIYALPLFALLIYQTQSRAGILGSVAAVGTVALLMTLRKSRRSFYMALVAVPLMVLVTIGGLWVGSSMFRDRMQPVVKFAGLVASGKGIDAGFNDFRPLTWLDTLSMIKDHPALGFGPGNYGATFEDYRIRVKALRMETVHAHNEYLEMVAEYGLVGGLLVLWVLVSFSVQMVRFVRTSPRPHHALPAIALLGALAGTAVHGFFDFELHIFPNALMLALLAGCAAAPFLQTVPEERPKWNNFIQWIFAFTVLLAATWSIPVMSSAWIRDRGDRALAVQKIQQAEKLYKTAWKIDPQNWLAQWGLGQIYYQYRYRELDPFHKQEWAHKEHTAYTDAHRINAKKEEVVYGLGRAELFLGSQEQGLDCLRQAANYRRFNDFYWIKLGIELREAGLYEESLSAFEYVLKLDGSNKTARRNIEWLNKQKKSVGK